MNLDLSALMVGSSFTDKVVYIPECSIRVAKNGKPFVAGILQDKDIRVDFKVWDAPWVTFFTENSVAGHTLVCSGRIGVYQDVVDVTLTGCSKLDPDGYPASKFFRSCDVPAVWADFLQIVQSSLSAPAMEVLQQVLTAAGLQRFQEEFAGAKMHDAQVGGLLNHTTKMCKLAWQVIQNEPRFATIPYGVDLLMLGVVLHDIGKVREMQWGVYTPNSFVTHRTLGIELLHGNKDMIVQRFDEKFYYMLLSIIQGHHGEFGDAPTSVFAYFVHLIDMLDSQVTGIFDKLGSGDINTGRGDATVYCNGSNLVF